MTVLDYVKPTPAAAPSAAYHRAVRHIRRAALYALAAGGAWYAGFLSYAVRQRRAMPASPSQTFAMAGLVCYSSELAGVVIGVRAPHG